MKNILALLAAALLTACGGGDIVFSGPVTVTGNTITIPVTASVSASAPAPAASTPAPTPTPTPTPTPDPVDTSPVPLAAIVRGEGWPATLDRGQFQFCSGGICYSVIVKDLGEWGHVTVLLKNTNPSAGGAWTGVQTLDTGTDSAGHAPPGAGPTEVRRYLLSYIVPAVNSWFAANPALFSGGVTVKPQTTLPLGDLTGPAMAAAMFAKHARIVGTNPPVLTLAD